MQHTKPAAVPMDSRIRGWKVIASHLGVSRNTAEKYAAREERRLKVRFDHLGVYTTQGWIDDFITSNDQSYDEAVGRDEMLAG